MIDEARRFTSDTATAPRPFRVGVSTNLRPLRAWKQQADFLFVQMSFDVEALLQWRDELQFDGPVYAGDHGPTLSCNGPKARSGDSTTRCS